MSKFDMVSIDYTDSCFILHKGESKDICYLSNEKDKMRIDKPVEYEESEKSNSSKCTDEQVQTIQHGASEGHTIKEWQRALDVTNSENECNRKKRNRKRAKEVSLTVCSSSENSVSIVTTSEDKKTK